MQSHQLSRNSNFEGKSVKEVFKVATNTKETIHYRRNIKFSPNWLFHCLESKFWNIFNDCVFLSNSGGDLRAVEKVLSCFGSVRGRRNQYESGPTLALGFMIMGIPFLPLVGYNCIWFLIIVFMFTDTDCCRVHLIHLIECDLAQTQWKAYKISQLCLGLIPCLS